MEIKPRRGVKLKEDVSVTSKKRKGEKAWQRKQAQAQEQIQRN